jgi:competence protein ComEC
LPVGTLLYHDERRDPDWDAVREAATERQVPLRQLREGQRLRLGSAVLEVLGPMEDSPGIARTTNDRSVVARWECGPASVLLTGDIGGESEARLLRWGPRLQSDVLKVGHHGSAGSTSSIFLQAARPEVALISCGRANRYGHPTAEALARLQTAGVPAYRTDRCGMITIMWPGDSPRVEPYLHDP